MKVSYSFGKEAKIKWIRKSSSFKFISFNLDVVVFIFKMCSLMLPPVYFSFTSFLISELAVALVDPVNWLLILSKYSVAVAHSGIEHLIYSSMVALATNRHLRLERVHCLCSRSYFILISAWSHFQAAKSASDSFSSLTRSSGSVGHGEVMAKSTSPNATSSSYFSRHTR
jgi:hypothetical protein